MPDPAAPPAPPTHNQAFFLALARQGREVWNAWRRDLANVGVRVTFEGVDFGVAPYDEISFEGFGFGDWARFAGCRWRGVSERDAIENKDLRPAGRAWFAGAIFGDDTNFTGVTFGDQANFKGAAFGHGGTFVDTTFGDRAIFTGAIFGDTTYFQRATFGFGACFADATFGYLAIFTGATFGGAARFARVTFGDAVDFSGATFGNWANFAGATFGRWAGFAGATFGNFAGFQKARFRDDVDFSARKDSPYLDGVRARRTVFDPRAADKADSDWLKLQEAEGFGPGSFAEIDFSDAVFTGPASFARRSFGRPANFTGVRFLTPPDFSGATNTGNIDFTGARVRFNQNEPRRCRHGWTTDTKTIIQLRAFRAIAETTRNHDLERDLYIEERKAERGVYFVHYLGEIIPALKDRGYWAMLAALFVLLVHLLWIALMGLYWLLSDYGRSVARPLVALAASVGVYRWLYAQAFRPVLLKAMNEGALSLDQMHHYKAAGRSVALGNAVPFVGPLTIDADIKRFLFCALGSAEKLKDCIPTPPPGYQWLVLSQNLVSIALVFFLGLALRNYFKLK